MLSPCCHREYRGLGPDKRKLDNLQMPSSYPYSSLVRRGFSSRGGEVVVVKAAGIVYCSSMHSLRRSKRSQHCPRVRRRLCRLVPSCHLGNSIWVRLPIHCSLRGCKRRHDSKPHDVSSSSLKWRLSCFVVSGIRNLNERKYAILKVKEGRPNVVQLPLTLPGDLLA